MSLQTQGYDIMAKKSDTKATETQATETHAAAGEGKKKGKKKGAAAPAAPESPTVPVVTPSDADAPIVNKPKDDLDLTRNEAAAEQFTTVRLPVKGLIRIIPSLNARNLGKPIDKEDPKFLAFAASMHDEGQHEPSVVQYDVDGIPVLLAGFRRQAANEVNGVEETTYMVKPGVFEMVSARSSNLIENVDREQLTPVELVYGMFELKKESAKGGDLDKRKNPEVLSNDEIARRLRLNKSTVGNYLRIATHLIPDAQKVFRGEKKGFVLPVETAIEWAYLDAGDQQKRLDELLKGKKGENAEEGGEGGEGGEGDGNEGEGDDKKPVGMVKREKIVDLIKSFDRVKRGLKKIADAGEKMKSEEIDEAIGYHEIKIGTKWERVDMEMLTYIVTSLKHVLDRKKEKIRYVEPVEAAGEDEEEGEE